MRGVVEFEAWRYADGSEAKAKAETWCIGDYRRVCQVWHSVDMGFCQVVKMAITRTAIKGRWTCPKKCTFTSSSILLRAPGITSSEEAPSSQPNDPPLAGAVASERENARGSSLATIFTMRGSCP